MPKFVHSPLQNPQRQIRLLRFSAGSDPVDLRCSLSTHNLHDAPEFVALSYECGPPDATLDIIVEGRAYTIRHNLSLLLSHIQRRPQCLDAIADGFLWVDAICISQTDTAERNTQVAMMGSIYQAAVTTYAWLGWPDRFDPRPVRDFMIDAASPANQASVSEYCDALCNNAMLMGTRTIDLLPQVFEWCCSSYFNRRWVVQEIFLSKMVILVCGESAIRMPLIKPLMRVVETLASYPYSNDYARSIRSTLPYGMVKFVDQYAHKPYAHKPIHELDQMYERHSTSSPSSEPHFLPPKASLHAVLHAFQDTQCERAHDGLYAILSLVEGGGKIAVDYLLTPEALLHQVLSQKEWSDMASATAIVSALGLTRRISWQDFDVSRKKTGLKGDGSIRTLLPAQEVTCLGHIQTIFEIPDKAMGHLEMKPEYEGSTLSQKIEVVERFFNTVQSLARHSWVSNDSDLLDHTFPRWDPVLFVTDYGYAGFGKRLKPGDAVCVLQTAYDFTIILREQEKSHFRMIGTATLCDKLISTVPPPPEAFSLQIADNMAGTYDSEKFVSTYNFLRQICVAKAHANSFGKPGRYTETLDVQIDMWDWVQYACSDDGASW